MKTCKVESLPYSHQWQTAAGVTGRGWPFILLEALVVFNVKDDVLWRLGLDDSKGIRVLVHRITSLQN